MTRIKIEVTVTLSPMIPEKRKNAERCLTELPGVVDLAVLSGGGWITFLVPSDRMENVTAYWIEMKQAIDRVVMFA